MVQVPSSQPDLITNSPAFVQARLTLERCIREYQQQQCLQNAAPAFPSQQQGLPINQHTYGCPQGCCPACICKSPDQFQEIVNSEWLPTQFVMDLLQQLFQALIQQQGPSVRCHCVQTQEPLVRCYCTQAQDQPRQLATQFLEYFQSQLIQQQNKVDSALVQALPGPGQISLTPHYFQLVLDVSGIEPTELKVSVRGRCVMVGAERKGRVTAVTHQEALLRRYDLPMDADSDQVQCSLSSDGLLHIAAPWRGY